MGDTPLRVLIVDDEAPARRRLRELLDDCAGGLPLSLVGDATNGQGFRISRVCALTIRLRLLEPEITVGSPPGTRART